MMAFEKEYKWSKGLFWSLVRLRSLEDVSGEGCQHRMDLVTSDIQSNGQESCEVEPLLSNLWPR